MQGNTTSITQHAGGSRPLGEECASDITYRQRLPAGGIRPKQLLVQLLKIPVKMGVSMHCASSSPRVPVSRLQNVSCGQPPLGEGLLAVAFKLDADVVVCLCEIDPSLLRDRGGGKRSWSCWKRKSRNRILCVPLMGFSHPSLPVFRRAKAPGFDKRRRFHSGVVYHEPLRLAVLVGVNLIEGRLHLAKVPL
jgi:hypothetical protein